MARITTARLTAATWATAAAPAAAGGAGRVNAPVKRTKSHSAPIAPAMVSVAHKTVRSRLRPRSGPTSHPPSPLSPLSNRDCQLSLLTAVLLVLLAAPFIADWPWPHGLTSRGAGAHRRPGRTARRLPLGHEPGIDGGGPVRARPRSPARRDGRRAAGRPSLPGDAASSLTCRPPPDRRPPSARRWSGRG